MTLNRLLLLPKPPSIHSFRNGLPKSTRWCSSSPRSGAQKPPNSGEQRAVATMGDSDNKCLERHSGTFINPINFQDDMGKTFRTLKGIFGNLKAKVIGTSQSQEQNSVERIASAADETVPEVIKTKDSPQDSQIGRSNHSIAMPNVITDSQICMQNISTGLRSDIVGDNSLSDVLDATVEPKSLGSPGSSDAKNAIQSTDIVFSPENLVAVAVSEVRKDSVSENKSTSDTLHTMKTSSMWNSAVQVVSNGKRAHGGHKDVEYGRNKSLFQSLETIADSHKNEKRVTETAASNMIRESPSKNIGQSEVKPESLGQLELGVSRSDFGCLSSFTHRLPGEASRKLQKDIGNISSVIGNGNPQQGKRTILQKDIGNISSVIGNGNPQQDKRKILDQPPTAGSDVGKMPSFSCGPQQVQGLANIIKNTITSNESDTLASDGVLNTFNKTNDEFVISGLLGCLQEMALSCGSPNNTDLSKKVGSVKTVQSSTNVQENDAKRKESSLRVHAIGKETSQEDLRIPGTSCLKKLSTESKVMVRFLHISVQESSIYKAFGDCGCITRIKLLPLIDGSIFRAGYVHFKTAEGSHKALMKSGIVLEGHMVVVDANSLKDVPKKIVIPNLIGNPEVPLMLVKSPTRTVMIKQLTHDISIHQLKEALAFCGSGISSVFFGSSSSVAYVEFETEDAKERAIAAYSINVQEKQLLILRIDVPRTTVIRITSVDDTLFSNKRVLDNIMSVCGSSGKMGKVKLRKMDMLDVYFNLDQWPKMLSILNRLNGMEVDGHRLIAQPAPIFPPAVLQILWNKPDERIHVKSVLCRLLQNTDLPVELSNLATKYHGDKYVE